MSLSLEGQSFPGLPIISSYSQWMLGPASRWFATNPTATTAWVTANQARYVPLIISEPYNVVKLMVYCGTTSGSGNNDMAVYDAAGTEVIAATAAAHPAAANWQEFNVTDTVLMPGLYYVGILHTTTTGTFLAWTNKEIGRVCGVFSQAVGAGNMPSPTATFAALDQAVIPVVAVSNRVTI